MKWVLFLLLYFISQLAHAEPFTKSCIHLNKQFVLHFSDSSGFFNNVYVENLEIYEDQVLVEEVHNLHGELLGDVGPLGEAVVVLPLESSNYEKVALVFPEFRLVIKPSHSRAFRTDTCK